MAEDSLQSSNPEVLQRLIDQALKQFRDAELVGRNVVSRDEAAFTSLVSRFGKTVLCSWALPRSRLTRLAAVAELRSPHPGDPPPTVRLGAAGRQTSYFWLRQDAPSTLPGWTSENYLSGPATGSEGIVTLPALVPGLPYTVFFPDGRRNRHGRAVPRGAGADAPPRSGGSGGVDSRRSRGPVRREAVSYKGRDGDGEADTKPDLNKTGNRA